MQEVTEQMRNFLQFIALQFITKPDQAQLKVAESTEQDKHIRFRLIVAKEDIAILIGKNGFTASAIRNVLKAAAVREGITTNLQIISHEEEHMRMTALENGEIVEEDDTSEESQDETDDEPVSYTHLTLPTTPYV